jgi:hypothetical protein
MSPGFTDDVVSVQEVELSDTTFNVRGMLTIPKLFYENTIEFWNVHEVLKLYY